MQGCFCSPLTPAREFYTIQYNTIYDDNDVVISLSLCDYVIYFVMPCYSIISLHSYIIISLYSCIIIISRYIYILQYYIIIFIYYIYIYYMSLYSCIISLYSYQGVYVYIYIYIFMMKSLFSSFISENFWAPQQESNPCLLIAGTVVLPLDYRVSEGKHDVN